MADGAGHLKVVTGTGSGGLGAAASGSHGIGILSRDGGRHRLLPLLLLLTAVNLVGFVIASAVAIARRDGILMNPVTPIGSDFVNLWAVGKLLISGAVGTIYDPQAFMAFQHRFTDAYIGLRLWAYPPHSLLFAWPFGFGGYFAGLALWSAFGLGFLTLGACRFGFDWRETAILVLSPAALSCIHYGQTGNFFAGLMLLALAPRSPAAPASALSAALLTIKPQTGFLLPVLWVFQRRWRLIALTMPLVLCILMLSLWLFGFQAWRDYAGLTVPALSRLERFGTGPFTSMIPTLFMSLRLIGVHGDTALAVHLVFAALVAAALLWRLSRTRDHATQAALVLVATCLITPYMHIYDLTLLLAAGLLVLRHEPARLGGRFYLAAAACLLCWFMPDLVPALAAVGVPVAPALLLALFFIIREAPHHRASPVSSSD